MIGAKRVLGAGRSRRPGRVKSDPSCTCEGQAKHETDDEDDALIKSSERDVGASDKITRGIGSERDIPVIRIARRSIRVDIRELA